MKRFILAASTAAALLVGCGSDACNTYVNAGAQLSNLNAGCGGSKSSTSANAAAVTACEGVYNSGSCTAQDRSLLSDLAGKFSSCVGGLSACTSANENAFEASASNCSQPVVDAETHPDGGLSAACGAALTGAGILMILVTGATGLNGSELVRRLTDRGVPVRALVRDAAKAKANPALAKAELAVGDLGKPDTLAAPLRGVDRAMLISSSTAEMAEVQIAFARAAKQAGVRHLVKLSGIMPELDSPFRFARMHGEIERAIEQTGIAYTHLRAGEFMQAYFRQVPAISGKGAMFLPMEEARIASIDALDIAEIAAQILTSDGHAGKIYKLTGPTANTMAEVAAILSAVLGKPIKYVNVPPEGARQASLANGLPPYLADGLVELFAERRKGKEGQVFPDAAQLLGRAPTSFEQFVRRNATIFRGEAAAPKL